MKTETEEACGENWHVMTCCSFTGVSQLLQWSSSSWRWRESMLRPLLSAGSFTPYSSLKRCWLTVNLHDTLSPPSTIARMRRYMSPYVLRIYSATVTAWYRKQNSFSTFTILNTKIESNQITRVQFKSHEQLLLCYWQSGWWMKHCWHVTTGYTVNRTQNEWNWRFGSVRPQLSLCSCFMCNEWSARQRELRRFAVPALCKTFSWDPPPMICPAFVTHLTVNPLNICTDCIPVYLQSCCCN